MRDQLYESLPVVQDLGFESVRQDRVGNDQHQDRRDPAREQNRDDDVEALEPVAVAAFPAGKEWDRLGPGHRQSKTRLYRRLRQGLKWRWPIGPR